MSLLKDHEKPPYYWRNQDVISPVLILCDHGGQAVPVALEDLGLQSAQLQQHIASDIGSAALTDDLLTHLQVPAIVGRYSRLVVDLNRDATDHDIMPCVSDGVMIPGNQDLSPHERQARYDEIFTPYHNAVSARLDSMVAEFAEPVVILLHSFTPQLATQQVPRPWQFGVLWHQQDPRLARPLMDALSAQHYVVGDNKPYDANYLSGYALMAHCLKRGIHHVLVEVRQDLLVETAQRQVIARDLAQGLQQAMKICQLSA